MAYNKQPAVDRATLMGSPIVRYRRCLERGDFSLEANTEAVPEPGLFYLLRNGTVLLQSLEYAPVEAAYNQLCREHWELQLTSETPKRRLAGAWGMIGLEPAHLSAAEIIAQDGTPHDQARLLRTQNRQRYLRRQRAA